jgi:undecaprenyl-diphosphatase
LGAFSLVAHSVAGQRDLTAFDEQVGRGLAAHRREAPALRWALVVLTQLGSMAWLASLTVVVALALLVRRRRLLALVWAVALVVTGLLNATLKDAFDRARPPWPDAAAGETNKSFPSGHSMGAVITYGLLAYFLLLSLRRRWARLAVVLLLLGLVLAIGFSRVYLGAHYPSDVAGGYALGGAWLCVCVSGLEVARRRAHHRKLKATAAAAEQEVAGRR